MLYRGGQNPRRYRNDHAPDCNLSPFHSGECGRQCGELLASTAASASWARSRDTCSRRAVFNGKCKMHAKRAGLLVSCSACATEHARGPGQCLEDPHTGREG